MAFISLPPDPPTIQIVEDDWYGTRLRNKDWFFCDSTRQFIRDFRVGEISYRPVKRLIGMFTPPFPNEYGRFSVPELPNVVGHGGTLDTARVDWEQKIDVMIQGLLGIQDFERTKENSENWELMSQCFDLGEIRYSTPLQIRNYGRLVATFPRPWKVCWIDGTSSILQRTQIPAELLRFSHGEEFEAVIEQDSRNGDLVRIVSVFRASRNRSMSTEEAEELLSNTASTDDFPELEWD